MSMCVYAWIDYFWIEEMGGHPSKSNPAAWRVAVVWFGVDHLLGQDSPQKTKSSEMKQAADVALHRDKAVGQT